MSASERLKALGAGFNRVTPIMRKTGPKILGADAYTHAKDIHAYVDALPQIVAVVGKVQILATHTYPATYAGERDGVKFYGKPEDLKRFVDEELAPALAALDEALGDA